MSWNESLEIFNQNPIFYKWRNQGQENWNALPEVDTITHDPPLGHNTTTALYPASSLTPPAGLPIHPYFLSSWPGLRVGFKVPETLYLMTGCGMLSLIKTWALASISLSHRLFFTLSNFSISTYLTAIFRRTARHAGVFSSASVPVQPVLDVPSTWQVLLVALLVYFGWHVC